MWVALNVNVDYLSGRHVGFICDNKPVVDMLIAGRAPLQRPDLQWMIRDVANLCLRSEIEPWFEWIEGDDNVVADNLSRFKPHAFAGTAYRPAMPQHDRARKELQRALDASAQFNDSIDPQCLCFN